MTSAFSSLLVVEPAEKFADPEMVVGVSLSTYEQNFAGRQQPCPLKPGQRLFCPSRRALPGGGQRSIAGGAGMPLPGSSAMVTAG
jgi:hypothetical protein